MAARSRKLVKQWSAYETLGVELSMATDDIHAVYIELAKRAHPDHGGDHDSFVEITRAWAIIRDPVLRKRHTLGIGAGRICTACEGKGERRRGPGKAKRCDVCNGSGFESV